MEKEAVAQIARMFGWDAHLGHLCGGGTMANLEALWVARAARGPGRPWSRRRRRTTRTPGSAACWDCRSKRSPATRAGAWTPARWARLETGGVGTVVATIGTTAIGSVDPLPEILELRERHGFRLHADAAYGGYFGLAERLARRRGAPSTGSARRTRS